MTTSKLRKRIVLGVLTAAAILLAAFIALLGRSARTDLGQTRQLPDGSTLELRQIVLTATNFNFSYQSGVKLWRRVASILPTPIRNRLNSASGSFGFHVDGATNLMLITRNRFAKGSQTGNSPLVRLRVSDERGESYDACWGAHTLGLGSEAVHGWQARAFPRRGRTLRLHFLPPDGGWTNVAPFEIPNPLFAEYPQWTPEPWPSAKSDGNLSVTLKEFQCGARMPGKAGAGGASAAARKTRLGFTFVEDGMPSDNWRVQKVTISDATGNRWFPYLDFVKQDFNWARGGDVEFFGALWPGENAWKLHVEVIRIAGFKADALWGVTITLPAPGTVATLTNSWQQDGRTLELVALASPNTEHTGDFRWVAKWWGAEKSKVYSLALKLGPRLDGYRLSVVQAADPNGKEAKVVQHGSQDSASQAVFFKPADDTTEVRFLFGLQRSRFVEFLARPEFVQDTPEPLER